MTATSRIKVKKAGRDASGTYYDGKSGVPDPDLSSR